MPRTPFKMKSGRTPLRQDNDVRSIKRAKLTNDINSFFSGLGKSVSDATSKIGTQLKKGQKERGIFSEAGKAEKKERRAGESKFKADVRRGKERRAKEKAAKADKPVTITPEKLEGVRKKDVVTTNKTTDTYYNMPDGFSDPIMAGATNAPKLEKATKKDTSPSGSSDSYQKKHQIGKYAKSVVGSSNGSTGEGFTVHNPGRKREAGKKSFGIRPPATLTFSTKEEADAYITENKGSFLKRSGFKMKNSPAKNYKKGYYGVK
jgi:hypothetical protein